MADSRFAIEEKYRARGFQYVIGLDEAGRGPLAGPVFAAAFALADPAPYGPEFLAECLKVRDSKQLSPLRRESIFSWLTSGKDFFWGCAGVSSFGIDRINILEASKLAMVKALRALEAAAKSKRPQFSLASSCLVIDGNFTLGQKIAQFALPKADQLVFSCSAASIIAKVSRDRLMEAYERRYPGYGFLNHKGYPTSKHVAAVKGLGVLPVHRKTFAPIAALWDNSEKNKQAGLQ